jgi:LL-diaminopimelate aminotransferase
MAYDEKGNKHDIHSLWNRRHCTKFNGVSYPVQRAAEAVYSPDGKAQTKALIDGYLENAKIIGSAISKLGFEYVGGDNSPYIWVWGDRDSWDFFDLLLSKAGVVCTPGAGFGKCGQGYIRISAFNSRENVEAAMERISSAI